MSYSILRTCLVLVGLSVLCLALADAADRAADAPEEVTILRDEFGTPNIFAQTEEGVAYGMGYAQAEDRLEELLKQYRRAAGTMAEAFGPEHLRDDYRQRLWRHRALAPGNYAKPPPKGPAPAPAHHPR